MTKDELKQKLKDDIAKKQARLKQLEKKDKARERKERTHRLVQIGAGIDKYYTQLEIDILCSESDVIPRSEIKKYLAKIIELEKEEKTKAEEIEAEETEYEEKASPEY